MNQLESGGDDTMGGGDESRLDREYEADDMLRGNQYFTARQDALAATAQNPPLRQLIEDQKLRLPKRRSQKILATGEQVQEAMEGLLPKQFIRELQVVNPAIANIMSANIMARSNGGITIKLPSSKGLGGTNRDYVLQARRVLRAMKGALATKKLQAQKYSRDLLKAKHQLSMDKKKYDPRGYVSQMRNYVKRYRTTNPQQVLIAADQSVSEGLRKAQVSIMDKVRGGIERSQQFPQTTMAQIEQIKSDSQDVAKIQQRLGIQGSYSAAPALSWENFRRIDQ